jgi:hypothetical protein
MRRVALAIATLLVLTQAGYAIVSSFERVLSRRITQTYHPER